jgi:hypothetical protein
MKIIANFFKKINFYRGFFRISLFMSFAFFLYCAFFEAPKFFPIAFGFTEKDKKEILEKYGTAWSFDQKKFEENPTYFIEWSNGKNSFIQVGMDRSTGKLVGCSSCKTTNKAIERLLEWEGKFLWGLLDYYGGYLIKNSPYVK